MRCGRVALVAVLCGGSVLVTASGASARAPAVLPIAWHAASPAYLNEPALTSNGIVTTADNTAIERGLAHGAVRWTQTIADQMGFHVSLSAPTPTSSFVDTAMFTVAGDGIADFALADGSPTLVAPTFHNIVGPLVVDRVASTRITGALASGIGAFLQIGLGGRQWYVLLGFGGTGLPAVVGTRAFVPVSTTLQGYDPAQGCTPTPLPGQLCLPTWQHGFGGVPNPPVGAGSGRIVTSDASNVVTALDAATGSLTWATKAFPTAIGPPAAAHGVVYIGGADGLLRALSAATGEVLWRGKAGAAITTAPTVQNGRVFVATDDGRLVTFLAAGCGTTTCTPTAVGNALLPGTHAAGAPRVRDHIAVVAFGYQLVAFCV